MNPNGKYMDIDAAINASLIIQQFWRAKHFIKYTPLYPGRILARHLVLQRQQIILQTILFYFFIISFLITYISLFRRFVSEYEKTTSVYPMPTSTSSTNQIIDNSDKQLTCFQNISWS